MILDATAGNRVMWREKYNGNVIYIDLQKQLERKPTIFADNTRTPFPDGTFDTVFFDPPHAWNWDSIIYGSPKFTGKTYSYYGMERYKNRTEYIGYLWRASRELFRILKEDGLLWLKWVEMKLSLERALTVFKDRWVELLRFHAKSPHQDLGEYKKFWLCLTKKKLPFNQNVLC